MEEQKVEVEINATAVEQMRDEALKRDCGQYVQAGSGGYESMM